MISPPPHPPRLVIVLIKMEKTFCNCNIWIYPENQKIKKCPTCLSLDYHDSIYKGLSNEEKLALFKKRTAKAFQNK